MKYFIAHITFLDGQNETFLFKAISVNLLESQLKRCADGCVSTSNFSISMYNVMSVFLQEITDFKDKSKLDFKKINESSSYSKADILELFKRD